MQLNKLINDSFERFGDNTALQIENTSYTYKELQSLTNSLYCAINAALSSIGDIAKCDDELSLSNSIAIFCYKSELAYAGILASILSGITYAPLNPKFPSTRTLKMLQSAKAKIIILDENCLQAFKNLAPSIDWCYHIISTANVISQITHLYPRFKFYDIADFTSRDFDTNIDFTNPAYLLFTSGSTGEPKGVLIARNSLHSYIKRILELFDFSSNDRFSQMFDLTFVLAVHDIFISFCSGACLCVSKNNTINPALYIQKYKINIFFCVPSVFLYMQKMKLLRFAPNVKYALFCGERLNSSVFNLAKYYFTNSKIFNIYGSTEASITAIRYQVVSQDNIPIGAPYSGLEVLIDESGEILLSGDQLATGYLNDRAKTDEKFIYINDKRYYKTGDLGYYKDGLLYCAGRIDEQIKINGFRVELGEVESALRKTSGVSLCACFSKDNKIYGAICANNINETEILSRLRETLPAYEIPAKIFCIGQMPLNANGKVDKNKLKELVDEI